MLVIAVEELSPEALLGIIDAFVLREGTDYGHRDIPLEEKRERVRALLVAGRAEICFYPESGHVDIQMVS